MTARRGVALVAALGLIAMLGILIAGAMAASMQAERATRLTHSDAILSAAADHAIGDMLERWKEFLLSDLPLGVPRTFELTVAQTVPVQVSVAATRLPDDLLWLVADARTPGGNLGRRRFGLVARFGVPGVVPAAGIIARGNVTLSDRVRVVADTSGDPDCAASRASPAVIVAPAATVTTADSVVIATAASALDSSAYYLTTSQRASLDSAIVVRHVVGDTTITGGSYQGILLVDGALRITGPFEAMGLVIARGPIDASDSVHVAGAMLSFASSPQTAISLSRGVVEYAPCVIARMLRRASPPRAVRERSWSEIF